MSIFSPDRMTTFTSLDCIRKNKSRIHTAFVVYCKDHSTGLYRKAISATRGKIPALNMKNIKLPPWSESDKTSGNLTAILSSTSKNSVQNLQDNAQVLLTSTEIKCSKLMMLEHCLGDRYANIIVAANSTKDVASGNEAEKIEENIKQDHTLLSYPCKPAVLEILHLKAILSKHHNRV